MTLNTNNSTKIITEKDTAASLQNKTTTFQKTNTLIAQQNATASDKHDHLKTKRQVQNSYVPVTSVATDMNSKQSFYQSPLMIYPFPMMNTYYPRYFPYTYQGYHHYPLFG